MKTLLDHPTSYHSDKLLGSDGQADGHGLFAIDRIAKGELLVSWGGQIMPREAFGRLPAARRSISLQVDEDLFLVPTNPGPADCVNHSCTPNAGMRGASSLVALRSIKPGEEICYDYAMTDGCAYDEFQCRCGAPDCRGRVTGDDWRDRTLWARYRRHFSPYLQERIVALARRRSPARPVVEQPGPLPY